jgi:hypothetical protein
LKPMTMTELKPKLKPFWCSLTLNKKTPNHHLMMDLLKNYSPLSKEDLTKSTLKLWKKLKKELLPLKELLRDFLLALKNTLKNKSNELIHIYF